MFQRWKYDINRLCGCRLSWKYRRQEKHYRVCLYSGKYYSERFLNCKRQLLYPQLKQNISLPRKSLRKWSSYKVSWRNQAKKKQDNVFHCDNQSVIHLTKNSFFHSRTKHIQLRYHFIRSLMKDWILKLEKISRAQNPADMLINAVTIYKLWLCSTSVGLLE